jgi:hypothetical protein
MTPAHLKGSMDPMTIADPQCDSMTGFDRSGIIVGHADYRYGNGISCRAAGLWSISIVGSMFSEATETDEESARNILRDHGAVSFTERSAGHPIN